MLDINPMKICVKALSSLLLYIQNWVVEHVTYAHEDYGDNEHQKQNFPFELDSFKTLQTLHPWMENLNYE